MTCFCHAQEEGERGIFSLRFGFSTASVKLNTSGHTLTMDFRFDELGSVDLNIGAGIKQMYEAKNSDNQIFSSRMLVFLSLEKRFVYHKHTVGIYIAPFGFHTLIDIDGERRGERNYNHSYWSSAGFYASGGLSYLYDLGLFDLGVYGSQDALRSVDIGFVARIKF